MRLYLRITRLLAAGLLFGVVYGCGGGGASHDTSYTGAGTRASVTATVFTSANAEAQVIWPAASLGASQNFIAYNIYRDGEIIDSLGSQYSYIFDSTAVATHGLTYSSVPSGNSTSLTNRTVSVSTVVVGVAHTYTVTVVYLDRSGGQNSYREVSLGTSGSVTLPVFRTFVTATAASATAATVSWSAAVLGSHQSLVAYNVVRDDTVIASITDGSLTFTDSTSTATHNLTYPYAIGQATQLSSRTVEVTPVETGVAWTGADIQHDYTVVVVYKDSSTNPTTYQEFSLGTSDWVVLSGQ